MRTIAENIVDALIVTLGLDSSEYQQGMDEAERSTREFSEKAPREAERGLNQIEQKFGGAFRGIFHSFIAPLTAALGTMGIFSSYTQTADRIGKTAARIGASAEDLQAFGEAAKRAGGSVEGFMGAFESLNGQLQRMQAMGGKGRLTPILKQLGISATENGQVKDTFQILRELAGAAERIGNRNFAGLARNLGLDNGTIMLLQQGRIALDEVIKRQKELGVYTKQDFEITAKFNDAISDLTQSFKQLAAPILRVITPALTTVANWITKIAQTFREHQGFIVAGLTVIAGVMSGTLLKAAVALGAALKPLLAPIAAIAALGVVFDEIAVYSRGGKTAFEGFWRAIGTPEQYRAVGKAIKDAFTGGWEDLKSAAKTVGEYLVKIGDAISPLVDTITPIVGAFKALVSATAELLGYVVDLGTGLLKLLVPLDVIFSPGEPGEGWSILKKIVEGVSLAIQSLAYVIEQAAKWLNEMTAKAREALKAFDFVNTVREWFADLANAITGIFFPGTPGSEWNALRAIIDGIKSGIDLMLGAVKDLLAWVEKVIRGIRSWWNSGENNNVADEQSVSAVTGGKPKEQYIAEQAAEIKKSNPDISDKEATEAAQNQLNADAALHRDYQMFSGDRLSLEQLGYSGVELDAYEKRLKAATQPKQAPTTQKAQSASAITGEANTATVKQPATRQAQAPAPTAQKESSPGWWASLFGGNGKAADTAAATVGSKAADKTEISQDFDNRKTINVKNDTSVVNNNTFNGVEGAAEIGDRIAQGTRKGVELGLSSSTPAVDMGVF